MVKSRKEEEFSTSDEYPQFFKVYVHDQSSKRLRIPPAFVKQLKGVVPDNSVISNSATKSWRVDLSEVDGHLYFQNGWEEFVLENSLEFGDFLIFYYDGNSKFYVKIYGKHGCLKEVAQKNQIQLEPRKSIQATPKDKNNNGHLSSSRRMGLRPRVQMVTDKRDTKTAAAVAIRASPVVSSARPFFKLVMPPAYVERGFMNIPASFKDYMDKDRESVMLTISGRLWPVRVSIFEGIRGRFSQGWRTFVKECHIQAGDVCVFQLVDRKNFVLKVSIHRCLGAQ